jgi:hypothetical protein
MTVTLASSANTVAIGSGSITMSGTAGTGINAGSNAIQTTGTITAGSGGLKVVGSGSGTATIVTPSAAGTPTLTLPTTTGTLLNDASSLTATKINAGVQTITSTTDLSADTTTYALIVNNASATVITLPTAANNTGRIMKLFHTTTTGVTSASSNVISPTGTTGNTFFTSASIAGKFSEIICNGTNWQRVFEN